MAYNINSLIDKSTFDIKVKDQVYDVLVPVPGLHFIYNSLCAISVGNVLGINNNKIIDGIKKFELSKNRMEIIKLKEGIELISDCYNANYDSMKAAIEILGKYKTRKIAVLGDMLELGDYSKELHQKIGKLVDINNIDILICVGELSKYIYESSNICKYMCKDNKEAIELLKSIIKSNDIILFKASNSMNFIEIVKKIEKI